MKKFWRAAALVLAAAVFAAFLYVGIGSARAKALMHEYLAKAGYAAGEIESVSVGHSFLNIILSYNEWIIRVRYKDEPGAVYTYTVRDGEIRPAGVYGDVEKEDLKHRDEGGGI